jgi:hypothetical protein
MSCYLQITMFCVRQYVTEEFKMLLFARSEKGSGV